MQWGSRFFVGSTPALLTIALYLMLLLVGYGSAGIALGSIVLQQCSAEHAARP